MEWECEGCGSILEVGDEQRFVVCDFCGVENTLPKIDSKEKMEEFMQANEDRFACRFDVAKTKYEALISKYPDDNNAYWGKILCEYGIEYVEDAKTERRIPTCHRTVRESIFDNSDYKLIVLRSSGEEKNAYERRAMEIEKLQKAIIERAEKEMPYDIFICYKETEADGKKRTVEAQKATQIYNYLTERGYKVFFARISLKGLIGQYEPVIYSALSSAKVMLHVTTSRAHTDAVWVRNEWSRFLEFMQKDATKAIIPCIDSTKMGAYDLPDKLSNFQVWDVSAIDFFENLIIQINSKFGRKTSLDNTVSAKRMPKMETQQVDAKQETINNYLERIEIFLEDRDWAKADEYAERILDISPKNGKAYLVKTFCSYKASLISELESHSGFTQNPNFIKAIRFADEDLKASLLALKEPTVQVSVKVVAKEKTPNKGKIEVKEKASTKEKVVAKGKSSIKEKAPVKEKVAVKEKVVEKGKVTVKEKVATKEKTMAKEKVVAKKEEPIKGKAVIKDSLTTTNVPTVAPVHADVKVGEVCTFGKYYVKNNTDKENIEWQVIAIEENRALLISKYALDCKSFNTKYVNATWDSCTLRTWLNNDFIENAFTKKEKSLIPTMPVSADKNPNYNVSPGKSARDKVFLLSIVEVNKYLRNKTLRRCKPTAYALARKTYLNNGSKYCWWWLRSPGNTQNRASLVNYEGEVFNLGYFVNYGRNGIRPALWINLEKLK